MGLSLTGLDDRLSALELRQLSLPTRTDISILSSTITSQWNSISNSDSGQSEKLDLLTAGFASLQATIFTLQQGLIAHTGSTGLHNT
jgi:uncharacterized coiled-coil protein SlyX